jgi:methionyl-tRNA synthetase
MITRMNRDLANDYGNLVQRVLSMIQRNCDGSLPQPGALTADDRALLEASVALLGRVREEMAGQALNRALEAIFEVIGAANRYVDAQAPWALRKADPARMQTVLFVLAETIRRIALLTQAFMPEGSARILDQLAVPQNARSLRDYLDEASALTPRAALPAPSGVFPRLAAETVGAGR